MAPYAKKVVSKLLDDPLDDMDSPSAAIKRYLPFINPVSTVYEKFRSGLARLEKYYGGRVSRHSNHYVHERTTTFEPDTDVSTCEDRDPEEAALGQQCDEVIAMISDEIVNINRKIYQALERAYNWECSEEHAADNIRANEYTFDEEGGREDEGGEGEIFQYDQLSDEAKKAARAWFLEGDTDDFWSEPVLDAWKTELEDMGFYEPEIAYSGFGSQGDGASFTCKSFDFDKWAAWWAYAKSTERGHPYSDDLFLNESEDLDSPEAFDIKSFIDSPCRRLARVNGFKQGTCNGHEQWFKTVRGRFVTLTNMHDSGDPGIPATWHLMCDEGTAGYGSDSLIQVAFENLLKRLAELKLKHETT